METFWLLKQWVLPVMGSGDLDRLAAASPILSAMTRKERMRMQEMRVIHYRRMISILWMNHSLLRISISMAGIRYSA